ncbi:MAG: MarR family transcriptional regulator [Roseovarius sp.]
MTSPEENFDPDLFLPYLLAQAAEAAGREFEAVYRARFGIRRAEWRVLFHLGQGGRMTATRIAARAALHKTKVSRAVARLAERRFVLRERCETDRRAEYLDLTAAGRAAFRDLRREAARYDARLMAAFSPRDAALLRAMLCRLAAPRSDGT